MGTDDLILVEPVKSESTTTSTMTSGHPGFFLCQDNVGIHQVARQQSGDHKNKYLLWANCYAGENRISGVHLDDSIQKPRAVENWYDCLPSPADYEVQKLHFVEIIKRILVKHMKHFSEFYSDCIEDHIEHEHTKASGKSSTLWNLGVIPEDPGSTAGSVAVCQKLSKYVPQHPDGKPFP